MPIVLDKEHSPRKIKDKFPYYPVGTLWKVKSVCCSTVYKQIRADEAKGNEWEAQYSECPEDCPCLVCDFARIDKDLDDANNAQ